MINLNQTTNIKLPPGTFFPAGSFSFKRGAIKLSETITNVSKLATVRKLKG